MNEAAPFRQPIRAARPVPVDLRPFLLPLAVVGLAEVMALLFVPQDSFSLAAPHQIAVEFARMLVDGTFLTRTLETMGAAMAGLALGGLLGLALGVMLGLSDVADRVTSMTVELLRPMPPTALIPLSLLVFGFGLTLEIAIVVFTTIWPVLVLSRAAVRETEPRLMEVAKVLRMSFFHRLTRIVIPGAIPRIFVAFRLAAAIALIVSVTVEIVANPRGLGYGMMLSSQALRPATAFAFLAWIAIVGWGFNRVLIFVERYLFGGLQGDAR